MACPPEKLLAALQRQASGSEDVPVQMDRQASSDEKGCIRDEQDSPGAQEPDSDGARLPPPGWGGSPTGLLNQHGQESGICGPPCSQATANTLLSGITV